MAGCNVRRVGEAGLKGKQWIYGIHASKKILYTLLIFLLLSLLATIFLFHHCFFLVRKSIVSHPNGSNISEVYQKLFFILKNGQPPRFHFAAYSLYTLFAYSRP